MKRLRPCQELNDTFEVVLWGLELVFNLDASEHVIHFAVFHRLAIHQHLVRELVITQVMPEEFHRTPNVLLVLGNNLPIDSDEVTITPEPLIDSADDGLPAHAKEFGKRGTALHFLP